MLLTQGLGKDFGERRAVDALDLEVGDGTIVGLLGPNGAGKTTAISMISGVLTPTRGTAAIGGIDVRRDPIGAKRRLGLVPQDLALYEDLSARDNLHFFGRLAGMRGGALASAVAFGLDLAGLADRAADRVSSFSGGMKRRLNLAAGLLHKPRLAILDEPTVGVDPQSRAHIFDVVRRMNQDERMTIVYTSHYMEEVEALCPRVAILDHGRLVADDAVADLVARHADGSVEVLADVVPADAAARLATLGETIVTGNRLRVRTKRSLGEVATALEGAGIEARSIARHRPDLEAVFLSLTGRSLRDES